MLASDDMLIGLNSVQALQCPGRRQNWSQSAASAHRFFGIVVPLQGLWLIGQHSFLDSLRVACCAQVSPVAASRLGAPAGRGAASKEQAPAWQLRRLGVEMARRSQCWRHLRHTSPGPGVARGVTARSPCRPHGLLNRTLFPELQPSAPGSRTPATAPGRRAALPASDHAPGSAQLQHVGRLPSARHFCQQRSRPHRQPVAEPPIQPPLAACDKRRPRSL